LVNRVFIPKSARKVGDKGKRVFRARCCQRCARAKGERPLNRVKEKSSGAKFDVDAFEHELDEVKEARKAFAKSLIVDTYAIIADLTGRAPPAAKV